MLRTQFLIPKILSVLLFLSIQSVGQIKFLETDYSFGRISNENSRVSKRFEFINQGLDDIRIDTVIMSCDCLLPEWNQSSIAPQDTGVVLLKLDLTNRVGVFEKTAQVKFGDNLFIQLLTLTGERLNNSGNNLIEFKIQHSNLSLVKNQYDLGILRKGEIASKALRVYNHASTAITADEWVIKGNNGFGVIPNSVIQSDSDGVVLLTYDSEKDPTLGLGYQVFSLTLVVDSISIPLEISTSIIDQTFENLEYQPKLTFDKTNHSFQNVTKGNTVSASFTLTNEGNDLLHIKEIKTNCGCATASIESQDIMSGESVEMQVSFDTEGRSGRQYKMISIFSNDPLAPVQTVSISAILN